MENNNLRLLLHYMVTSEAVATLFKTLLCKLPGLVHAHISLSSLPHPSSVRSCHISSPGSYSFNSAQNLKEKSYRIEEKNFWSGDYYS
jgi:hypothetical protein